MAKWIEPWIGFDLDGTIANDKDMSSQCEIGPPVQKMIDKIKQLRREGKEVKIVTSRVDGHFSGLSREVVEKLPDGIPDILGPFGIISQIENWCQKHIGEVLPITDRKNCGMQRLYDDKVIRVNRNTGELCSGCYNYLNYGVEQTSGKRTLGDRYYEVEEIGGGQISAVYRAIGVDKKITALKTLRDKWLANSTVVKQFDIECEIIDRLGSFYFDTIIKTDSYEEIENRKWIIMDYVISASSVDAEIKKGKRYTIEETVQLLKMMALDLDDIHEDGIYHCDIKPGNILLRHGTYPVLVDFGVGQLKDSKWVLPSDELGITCHDYIAPEIKRGERATSRSDQYMLGMTVLEMLIGSTHLKVPPNIPLIKALDPNPDRRFNSCYEFINELENEIPE